MTSVANLIERVKDWSVIIQQIWLLRILWFLSEKLLKTKRNILKLWIASKIKLEECGGHCTARHNICTCAAVRESCKSSKFFHSYGKCAYSAEYTNCVYYIYCESNAVLWYFKHSQYPAPCFPFYLFTLSSLKNDDTMTL